MTDVVKYQVDDRGVATLTLNRPDVRNALNGELAAAVVERVTNPGAEVRLIVLRGAGPVFCAGADLGWMREATPQHAVKGIGELSRMFGAIDACPVPIVGRIHGAAMAGATGLVSCCDIAIAAESTIFAFTEVRIGLVPAIIAPYVMRRVGYQFARHKFLTAERFGTDEAARARLIDVVAPDEELDVEVNKVVDMLLLAAPNATRLTRKVIDDVLGVPVSGTAEAMTNVSARSRTSDEGREGIAAFFAKRPPSWAKWD